MRRLYGKLGCQTSNSTIKQDTILQIQDVKYHMDQIGTQNQAGSFYNLTIRGANHRFTKVPLSTAATSFQESHSTSFTVDGSLSISLSTSITVGIPQIGEGMKITVGTKTTFNVHRETSSSLDVHLSETTPSFFYVPSRSYCVTELRGKVFNINVPFTATGIVLTPKTLTQQEVKGSVAIGGVSGFVTGNIDTVTGPNIPIECQPPFNDGVEDQLNKSYCGEATEKCVDNVMCKRFWITGQNGTCCNHLVNSTCCAQAKFHPTCMKMGFAGERSVCPFANGQSHSCCSTLEPSNALDIPDPPFSGRHH